MQKLFRSLIAVGGLMGLAACGDDVSVTEPPPPPLTISGAPVTAVSVGARVQLSASEAVTWLSSAANVASVDANGLVTAAAAGTASITATATADVNRKASVTITVTAPAVRSVTVSPDAVVMNFGEARQFVANVDADAGVARTVTWTSSNPSVASVNATSGVVTAQSAAGAATITATSTANTAVSGAAAVTVRQPTAARVSIQKVTVAGNLNAPVNLAATAGQIDVTIDIDPGDFIATKVDLLVDNVVVGSQNFTAAQSVALTNAHAMPDIAAAVTSTVISFNTAAFNPTTGAVLAINQNGPHLLSARLTTTTSGTGGSTATPSTNLAITFANANTWLATLAFTGTTASANNAVGLAYRRGGLDVTTIFVIYNPGQSVAAGSVNFGSFACDASGIGPRSAALSGSPMKASLAQTGTPGAGNVANYEHNGICLAASTGEAPTVTATDNNGNTIFAATVPANAAAGIRLDNRAPARGGALTGDGAVCNGNGEFPGSGFSPCESGVPVLNFNVTTGTGPNGRTGGWMNNAVVTNATVNITATGTTGADNLICNNTSGVASGNCPASATSGEAPSDAGVGGVAFQFKGAATNSHSTAAGAAAITSLTPLGESTTNTTLCGVGYAVDALGNSTATNPTSSTSGNCSNVSAQGAGAGTPAGTNVIRFGDDFTAPTVAWDASSLADGARINTATLVGNFVLLVNDPGAPLSASGIQGSRWLLRRTRADGATNRDAAGGTVPSGTSAPIGQSAPACGAGLCSTNIGAQATTAASGAFWNARGQVVDAAGNLSPELTRTVVGDGTVAVVTGPSVPASISGSFAAAGASSDNLDLRDFWFSATFGGGGIAYLAPASIQLQQPIAVNTFPPVPATLQNSNVALSTTVSAPLILQATTGAGAPVAYSATAPNSLTAATVNVRDQTQAAYVSSTQLIPFASLITPSSGISTANFTSFITTANNTSLCAVAAATAGCVVGTPAGSNFASTVIQARALGVTSVFNNPFGRVDFFCDNGAGQLLNIGSSPSPALNDNGAIRTFDYVITVSAAQLFATCGGVAGGGPGASITPNIWAFGMNAAGTVAMVAQALVGVTINP